MDITGLLTGEGSETIFAIMGVLLAIIIIIVAWQVIKKKRSLYTYKYQS